MTARPRVQEMRTAGHPPGRVAGDELRVGGRAVVRESERALYHGTGLNSAASRLDKEGGTVLGDVRRSLVETGVVVSASPRDPVDSSPREPTLPVDDGQLCDRMTVPCFRWSVLGERCPDRYGREHSTYI